MVLHRRSAMATPGRTTQLEAVNTMLAVIGEAPVNSLQGLQIGEAQQALSDLQEFHKDGQSRGWSWNTEDAYPFPKATDGTILVPDNVAAFTVVNVQDWGTRFVLRGQRVYDTVGHSYVLPLQLTTLEANVVWLLPWDDCPEAYNRWATIRAARAFAGRILGDASIPRLVSLDEEASKAELEAVETNQAQANWLGVHPAFPVFQPGAGLGRNWGNFW